ncbi:MAG: dihydrofolate reductase family protein, partial [Polyangiaceae bacterium]|nr:dihydrofolate reductase family protein [Polyangiaceae bacterium]
QEAFARAREDNFTGTDESSLVERLERVEVCVVPANGRGWVSLPHALAVLYARGVRRLLVEGGARVLTSFLGERLADYAEIEIAPRIFGDAALAAFGALAGDLPHAAVAIRRPTVERLGDNLILRGDVEYPA